MKNKTKVAEQTLRDHIKGLTSEKARREVFVIHAGPTWHFSVSYDSKVGLYCVFLDAKQGDTYDPIDTLTGLTEDEVVEAIDKALHNIAKGHGGRYTLKDLSYEL